jgi:hypothetical protein
MRAAAPFTGTFTVIEKFKKHAGCPTLDVVRVGLGF